MPTYHYRATHPSGRIQKGSLAASHEGELARCLSDLDLELIEARVRAPPLRLAPTAPTLRQRALLCSQLEDLLRAGVPFLTALQNIATTTPAQALRSVLENLARDISHGHAVAVAFGNHPRLFSPVFLAVLAAGEASGDLAQTFGHLSRQLQGQADLSDQLRRAVRYPLFLLGVALSVTTFMMMMVVPQIVDFLRSIAAELPFPTRLLIALSEAFAVGWWMVLVALTVGVAGLAWLRRHSEKGRLVTDGWLLTIPGLGPTLHKLAVARFTQCFAVLLQSGVDLPSSLRLAGSVLGNRALRAKAEVAEKDLLAGQPLSAATASLFTPPITQILRVGERSGQIAKTLDSITRSYENDANEAVKNFLGTLEPALTILVGALLGWVVLAVLGPIYGSLGKLGQTP